MTGLTVTSGDTTTLTQENQYNHEGIRISKTEGGVTRRYYYDNGIVAYTKDGATISSANVLSGDGDILGTYRGEDYHVYTKDVQNSVESIVKEDGSLAAAYSYSDFGETEELTGNNFDNEICYTGAVYDAASGLYYMNARYYDPANGRFISQDTYRGSIDNPGQWHLYAYCANDPINYVDPSEHIIWKAVGGIIVGTAAYKLGKSYGLKGWKLACCTTIGAALGAIVGSALTPLLKPVMHVFVNWGNAIGAVSKVGKFKLMFHWDHHGKGYYVVLQKFKKTRWRTVFEKGFYKPK